MVVKFFCHPTWPHTRSICGANIERFGHTSNVINKSSPRRIFPLPHIYPPRWHIRRRCCSSSSGIKLYIYIYICVCVCVCVFHFRARGNVRLSVNVWNKMNTMQVHVISHCVSFPIKVDDDDYALLIRDVHIRSVWCVVSQFGLYMKSSFPVLFPYTLHRE